MKKSRKHCVPFPNCTDQVNAKVYPKVSGLAAWSEDCKWYSSLLLGAVIPKFCESI